MRWMSCYIPIKTIFLETILINLEAGYDIELTKDNSYYGVFCHFTGEKSARDRDSVELNGEYRIKLIRPRYI